MGGSRNSRILLLPLLLPMVSAEDVPPVDYVVPGMDQDVQPPPPLPNGRPQKGDNDRTKKFDFAESLDVPFIPVEDRPFVFTNTMWNFDTSTNAPTSVIGTSRGICRTLQPTDSNNAFLGECSWTLTIHASPRNGASEEEVEEVKQPQLSSKIMLEGDTENVYWSMTSNAKERFIVVGGTGDYHAARGYVDVTYTDMFRLYTLHLSS